MELLKDLECMEVEWSSNDKKVTFTFFDENTGEIREVNYNKQAYKDGKYVDDPERAERTEQMLLEDIGLDWEHADLMQGQKADVYCYEKFNALHPVDEIVKFADDQLGEVYQTTIKEIIDGDYAIKIRYEIEGKVHESKMTHGKYIESMKKWARNPQKEQQVRDKFEKKFGVPVADRDVLIGKTIMVEVKKAFGSFLYGDIKKLPKAK